MFPSFNARAVGLAQLTAAETIELAAENGFDGVDLLVRDIVRTGDDPVAIRSRLDDRGLKPGAFPLTIDWKGDEATFQAELAALPRFADAAQVLGLTRTGTWVLPEAPDRTEAAAMHVRRLGAIARVLHDRGIRLGLEVIGPETFRTGKGKPFVTRLADLDRLLGPLWDESPNIGILADVFHLHAADESIDAALAWGIEKVVWAHVADLPGSTPIERSKIIDSDRGLPGENGAIDARSFLTRLATEGYDGPITAEPLSGCRSLEGLSPDEVARRVKWALDAVWPRP